VSIKKFVARHGKYTIMSACTYIYAFIKLARMFGRARHYAAKETDYGKRPIGIRKSSIRIQYVYSRRVQSGINVHIVNIVYFVKQQ